MSGSGISPFEALAAPRRSGDVLIEPAVSSWQKLIEQNRDLRKRYSFTISGRSFQQVHVSRSDGPLLLVGHQPEFFHPGVWAKNVVTVRAAATLAGEAHFLIVDNDTPDGMSLCVPTRKCGRLEIREIALNWIGVGRTFEQEPPRPIEQWRAIFDEAARCSEGAHAGLREFATGFCLEPQGGRVNSGERDYVARWADGIRALDRWIGVKTPQMHRVSRCSKAPRIADVSWGDFVAHLCVHGREFAAAYNAELNAYRAVHGIHGDRHPIPNLAVGPERVELPLWAWRGDEPRRRVHVMDGNPGEAVLLAEDERIGVVADKRPLSEDGELADWRIRPRALTLTLYARLFLCDLFVHGLGGAKYDTVTDGVIRRFFGVEPPAYVCVTATLFLPLEERGPSADEIQRAVRQMRVARHNPQRLLPASPIVSSLIAARIKSIAESDRLRGERPEQHQARRRIFDRIHELNESLRQQDPRMDEQVEKSLADVRARDLAGHIAQSREWFYALYPRESLQRLANG